MFDCNSLITKIKTYNIEEAEKIIGRVCEFSQKTYGNTLHKDGHSIFEHCYRVATILAELNADINTVAAGLLHKIWYFCDDSHTLIPSIGKELFEMVKLVTSVNMLNFSSSEDEQAINFRKMFIAMAKDVRVILIRLADQLDEMRVLEKYSHDEQVRLSTETLEIFAPLSHRLGMSQVKSELEDFGFKYLYPDEFKNLSKLVSERMEERKTALHKVIADLQELFKKENFSVYITGRTKHLYSTYKKMLRQNKDFYELYDLAAVRIIVDTVKDCYNVLGSLHTKWTPIPETFDDYIAMPKSNGYQSLHTVVVEPSGEHVEVQIRTWDMHMRSEYGVAAHWKYKEEGSTGKSIDDSFSWIQRTVDFNKDIVDAKDYLETIKLDLFEDEVFVYTPKGKILSLPYGATPVDFAYRIHTEIGHKCRGAKINGRIVQLDHILHNGDTVEILTAKSAAKPSRDWLNFAKSANARSKIKQWFKKAHREENISHGKIIFERELTRHNLKRVEIIEKINFEQMIKDYNIKSEDDFYAGIGCGDISTNSVISKLKAAFKEYLQKEEIEKRKKQFQVAAKSSKRKQQNVVVSGYSDILVHFSKCCFPLPHEKITGFVSKGMGLAIHRIICPNIQKFLETGERIVEVKWSSQDENTYQSEVEIISLDNTQLLSEIISTAGELKLNVSEIKSRKLKNFATLTNLVVEVPNLDKIENLMKKISGIEDIVSVRRKI